MKRKIFSILLCALLFFNVSFFTPASTFIPKANAALYTLPQGIADFIGALPGTLAEMATKTFLDADKMTAALLSQALLLNKIAALTAVQIGTRAIVGSGNDSTIIRDFNNYLYVSPQQKAMTQMNSFFNTVSRGRLSTLNYEGVGPNYDAYLVGQARMAIAGQPFSTNLQDLVTDPTQMFAGGNMKGLMTYMQCANNVACYTLTSTARYNSEFSKAQDIANKKNVNGFIPKELNGRVVQPAQLAQVALTQLDQLGTQLIMSATDSGKAGGLSAAITQVWEGAGITAAARLAKYGISDSAGKDAIRNQNDQFPFSIGYSTNGGVGISAGGVTNSTGLGSYNYKPTSAKESCLKSCASKGGNDTECNAECQ